mgnify:CR=1 FL=1
MSNNFYEIRDRAKAFYEQAKNALGQLQAARAEVQQAQANLNAAYYAVQAAQSQVNSARYSDDEDGSEAAYAQAALSSAQSQYMAAQAAFSSANQRVNSIMQVLRQCIQGLYQCIQEAETGKQSLESLQAKLGAYSSNRYMNTAQGNDLKAQTQNKIALFGKLISTCRQCISYIQNAMDNGEARERERER